MVDYIKGWGDLIDQIPQEELNNFLPPVLPVAEAFHPPLVNPHDLRHLAQGGYFIAGRVSSKVVPNRNITIPEAVQDIFVKEPKQLFQYFLVQKNQTKLLEDGAAAFVNGAGAVANGPLGDNPGLAFAAGVNSGIEARKIGEKLSETPNSLGGTGLIETFANQTRKTGQQGPLPFREAVANGLEVNPVRRYQLRFRGPGVHPVNSTVLPNSPLEALRQKSKKLNETRNGTWSISDTIKALVL